MKRVLLVHQDDAVLDHFIEQFQRKDIKTVTANSSAEAIPLCKILLPEVLFIDVMVVTEKQPFNFITAMLGRIETKDTPVILIEGLMRPSEVDLEKVLRQEGLFVIGTVRAHAEWNEIEKVLDTIRIHQG